MATYSVPREIFEVHAVVVDATGARNVVNGFPKTFDSKNSQFNNNIDACQQRAEAEAYKTFGDMLMVTTRQLQTVILQTVAGRQILSLSKGVLTPVEIEVEEPETNPEENPGEAPSETTEPETNPEENPGE